MRNAGDSRLTRTALIVMGTWLSAAGSAAAGQNEGASLLALRAQDQRVLTVGWRLAEAAADLCPSARSGLGWTLHALDQYRPGLRPAATRIFGLTPGRLGILALAQNGPAVQAGLRQNDVLIAVAGRPVTLDPRSDGRADYAPVEQALAQVEAAVTSAPLKIRVRRGEAMIDLTVTPRPHCPWPVQVEPSQAFAAGADGRRISITSRLADHARRDDDLAFLLGHEMAHNLRRPDETGAPLRSRAREEEADRIGLILAARAGYDVSGADEFMLGLGWLGGWRLPVFEGHPPVGARAEALRRTQGWIADQRLAGRPVRP